MAVISQKKVARFLRLCGNGASADSRGKALEDLICYIFEKIPGVVVNARDHLDFAVSQEIDIAIWNDSSPCMPQLVLIECKNWAAPVGADEFRGFSEKLRASRQDFGIFVALNGITGDPRQLTNAHNVIAGALRDGYRILVFTRDDITAAGTSADLENLIKKKRCQLAVHRTTIV